MANTKNHPIYNFVVCGFVFFIVLAFSFPLSAQQDNNKASNVLPTANRAHPATPTVQPAPIKGPVQGILSYGTTHSPAAPATQPTALTQRGMNEAIGSLNTQTEALPLPKMPDGTELKPEDGKKINETEVYVPPELKGPATPQTNIMLPPLYGWNRIVLDKIIMPRNQELVNSCGMNEDFIFSFFARRLQEGGIPVVSREQAERMVGEQIVLVGTPIIVSMEDLVINCTSWVQFQVIAEQVLRVPPMMYRRKIPIMFWHDGMMVTSSKSTHNGALINAFIDLAMRFRSGWDAQQAMVDPTKIVR